MAANNVRLFSAAGFMNNPLFSDVTFRVGPEQQVFHGHRFFLAAIYKSFAGTFVEYDNSHADKSAVQVIDIPDLPPAAFVHVLEGAYLGRLHLQAETLIPLYRWAKARQEQWLMDNCIADIIKLLTPQNLMASWLALAGEVDEAVFVDLLTQPIVQRIDNAVATREFVKLSEKQLFSVLEHPSGICVEDEPALFSALVRWAIYNTLPAEQKLHAASASSSASSSSSTSDPETKKPSTEDADKEPENGDKAEPSLAEQCLDPGFIPEPEQISDECKQVLRKFIPHVLWNQFTLPQFAERVHAANLFDEETLVQMYIYAACHAADVPEKRMPVFPFEVKSAREESSDYKRPKYRDTINKEKLEYHFEHLADAFRHPEDIPLAPGAYDAVEEVASEAFGMLFGDPTALYEEEADQGPQEPADGMCQLCKLTTPEVACDTCDLRLCTVNACDAYHHATGDRAGHERRRIGAAATLRTTRSHLPLKSKSVPKPQAWDAYVQELLTSKEKTAAEKSTASAGGDNSRGKAKCEAKE